MKKTILSLITLGLYDIFIALEEWERLTELTKNKCLNCVMVSSNKNNNIERKTK